MRQHSRSLLIYALFGIIIAVFIISFGPQSLGGFNAPGSTVDYAVKVGKREVTAQEYRTAFLLAGGDRFDGEQAKQARVREIVLDRLIDRELLAQQANELGLVVSREEAEDFVATGKFLLFGGAKAFSNEPGFSYDDFTRFIRYYGFTPATFLEMQQRELQAERVRAFLKGGLTVSPTEVKAEWEHRNTQLNLEYLRFPVGKFEAAVAPSAQDVAAYAAAHEAELKATYEKDKAFRYTKLPKEKKIEVVKLALAADAADADKQAATKKLEAVASAGKAGQALALAAKPLTADAKSNVTVAPPAWRREGSEGLGADLWTEVMAAADNAVLGPKTAEGSVYVVKVLGAREGDLAYDQVKLELAEEALRKDQATAKAKAAAESALAKAKEAAGKDPAKTLKDVFPSPAEGAPPVGDAPRAEETGLFMREGISIEGIGRSAELAKAAWALTPESPFFGPVEVASSFVVVRLKERKTADPAEFEKSKATETQMAETVKSYQVMTEWSQNRCKQVQQSSGIKVNDQILVYPDGKKGLVDYKPCTPASPFGI
ncbi:MAG: SurA N-terminal domain-containing protein [Deltaproteobacteria bacterium]|nr:SurA N-terminal domain-containing protein [Deltaproteobacteria bacterium]